jgi:hypothetical protein
MGLNATILPVPNSPRPWEHTTGVIRSAADRFASLGGSCAELNLLEEHRALAQAIRRLQRWGASVAITGSRHTGKTTLANALFGHPVIEPDTRAAECIAHVPGEPLLEHLKVMEVRLEDNVPLPECDVMLLLVSARAPLFDGVLQFLKRVRERQNLLIGVTHMASFPPAHGEAILEHVAAACGGFRVIGVDSVAGSGIARLESELHTLVIRKSVAPLVDALAAEALRICDTVENAASFNDRALRSAADEYERSYREAASDLSGLGRAILALEQCLARNESKLQALILRLTTGILNQAQQAAEERIEAAGTAGITVATAPMTLAAANEAAMHVFDHFQEYALKEFKHALALATSELDRVRAAAEIRLQEMTDDFLGRAIAISLIGPEPLSRSLDQAAPGFDDWLSARTDALMKSLAAPPAYLPQALDSLRQVFLSALKYSLRQHWERAGKPEDVLRALLASAVQQFLRSPVDGLQKEMVRVHKALENCFSSRRLELLALPSEKGTRELLASLNADRRRHCQELRDYAQRLAMELEP